MEPGPARLRHASRGTGSCLAGGLIVDGAEETALVTNQLLIGAVMVAASVCLHTLGLISLTAVLSRLTLTMGLHQIWRRFAAMTFTVLGVFLVITVEIWCWAACYLWVGALPDLETALYYSMTTFATVGFGDVMPPPQWRLLGACEGINGFLLIGWSTAYLVSAGTRVGPFKVGHHF